MKYIAIEVGCLECINDHYLYGIFNSKEEAEKSFMGTEKAIAKVEGEFGEAQSVIFEVENNLLD